jgi:mannose-6-phosphate isomerase-like protein (cupin superfamily)
MTAPTAVRADLLALARTYAANPQDWPSAPRFDPAGRWYARLDTGTDHETWLITWLPGQHTELHDHGGSAGAFVVVSGELTEQTLADGRGGSGLTDSVFHAGAGRRFGARHVHRVGNCGRVPAVSVHSYGPALRTMTRYRLAAGVLRVVAVDRAGGQW